MTLPHSLGTLGYIHILQMIGHRGDFSMTSQSLQMDRNPPSRVGIEGSGNYNENMCNEKAGRLGETQDDTNSWVWWPSALRGGLA